MVVVVAYYKLFAPWVHSLKEKRMEVKSLLARLRNRFNISAVEAEAQDIHQTIILGVAYLAGDHAQADRELEAIESYIEAHTQAELTEVTREFL